MPQQATWTNANHAPEYPPAAGAKTATDTRPVVETPIEARQGVTGHGARYVLLVSTAAIIVAFVVVYAVFLS